MPVSLPDRIKPPSPPPLRPQISRPQVIRFLTVALIGLFIEIAAQELRWRWSDAVPTSRLGQAEHDFQAGDNKAAVKLFDALADKNNPTAQYWLAHMTELGLWYAARPG